MGVTICLILLLVIAGWALRWIGRLLGMRHALPLERWVGGHGVSSGGGLSRWSARSWKKVGARGAGFPYGGQICRGRRGLGRSLGPPARRHRRRQAADRRVDAGCRGIWGAWSSCSALRNKSSFAASLGGGERPAGCLCKTAP